MGLPARCYHRIANHLIAALIIFLLPFPSVFAQEWSWADKIGTGGYSNSAETQVSVTDTEGYTYVVGNYDNNITLGSTTYTGGGLSGKFYIAKFDSLGNVIWSNSFNGCSYVNSIQIDNQGGVYVTGTFSGSIAFGNSIKLSIPPTYDPYNVPIHTFVGAYSSNGVVSWAKFCSDVVVSGDKIYSFGELHNGFSTNSAWNAYSDPDHGDSVKIYDANAHLIQKIPSAFNGNDDTGQHIIISDGNVWNTASTFTGTGYAFGLSKYDPIQKKYSGPAILPYDLLSTRYEFYKGAIYFLGCYDTYGNGHLQLGNLDLVSSDAAKTYHTEGYLAKYDLATNQFVWGKNIRKMDCGFNHLLTISPSDILYLSTEQSGTGSGNYIHAYSVNGDSLWTQSNSAYILDHTGIGADEHGNIYVTGTVDNGVSSNVYFGKVSGFIYDYSVGFLARISTKSSPGPVLISKTPASNETGVSVNSTFQLTFSKNIILGTGSLKIYNAMNNVLMESLPLSSTNVTIVGSQATIKLPLSLPLGTTMYVQITNKAFEDLSGKFFEGISGKSWYFSTAGSSDTQPPTLISKLPASGATLVDTNTELELGFSESILALNGSIYFYDASDDALVMTLPVTSSNTVINGYNVTITLPTPLPEEKTLYVNIDNNLFKDSPGNSFVGIQDKSWSFTTASSLPAPTANDATAITSNDFTANWTSVSGAAGYQLDVSSDDFATLVAGYNSALVTGTSQVVTGLTAGTSYQYRIRALTSSGSSANSNVISTTTLPPPVPVPVATDASNVSSTSLTANWNDVPGVIVYQLDVSPDNFASFQSFDVFGLSQIVTGLAPGTSYQYRVRVIAPGISENSNVISVTTLPPPVFEPFATDASNVSSTSFTANWNDVPGAIGYQLDVSSDDFATFLSFNVSGLSQIVVGLTPGTLYQYRVSAFTYLGTWENSNVITVTTLAASIFEPIAIAATSLSQLGFTSNWNSVSGATSYQLDISTDNFATFLPGYNSATVTGTSQIVTGLTAGTSYQYRVRAITSSGTSSNSNLINVTTLSTVAAPVATAATSVSTTGFIANWNSVSGATSYQLDISTDNFTTFLTSYNSKTETGTSQIVTGLTAGASYQYRVRAIASSGTSSNSNVISVTTLTSTVPAPVATTATSVSSTGFIANWNNVSGATGYRLDISTDNFTTFLTGYNSKIETGTFQVVTGLTSNTSYQYRVRATTSLGTSSNSNVVSVSTSPSPIAAPVAAAASNISSTSFTANWNSVAGATGYQLDISTDNFTTFLTGYNSKIETGTTQVVSGLTLGATYQYRVRASNALVNSTNSNVITTVTSTKSSQTISFNSIPDVAIGDPAITLTVSASSGLAVTLVSKITPAALTGKSFKIVLPGRDTITASQAGSATYFAAVPVIQTFCINPAKPVVTMTTNINGTVTLTSSSKVGNQWYLNGVPINGAAGQTLDVVKDPSEYTVRVKVDDCLSAPASINIPTIVTGDITTLPTPLTLYPNPSHDYIFIKGLREGATTASVIDLVGQHRTIELEAQGDNVFKGSISDLANGLYVLQISTDGQVQQIKFIKQ